MPGAMDSQIDASVLNAMRAFRRSSERQAEEKLALLRRLRGLDASPTSPLGRSPMARSSSWLVLS